ncbi:MAG: GTP-binding protein [Candidatus Helarchaeota archaeon]
MIISQSDDDDIQLETLPDNAEYDALYKLILLGDGAVGKTAIGTRFCKGLFKSGYKMTIGADFFIKSLRLDGKNMKYQIWDVAGQSRFKSLRNMYYRGASCGILVFDTTVYESFGNLENWVLEFQDETGRTPMIVVGNKVDLPDRMVAPDEAENFAKYINAPYIEVSAKSGRNINRLFASIYDLIKEHRQSIMIPKVKALPIDQAFDELEQILKTIDNQAAATVALKITRYSIFKEVPFSVTVQNMTQWIRYLENYGWNEQSRQAMLENIPAWKHNYKIINIEE